MTLPEFREEYESVRIGPKILAYVQEVVSGIVRGGRYDPQIYAGSANWGDAEDDVLQGVVTEILIQEGQLDFLMATAATLDDFRNLLTRQVRRYLARRRRRSVIDNLLDR